MHPPGQVQPDLEEGVAFPDRDSAQRWWEGFTAGQATPNLFANQPREDTDGYGNPIWIVQLVELP